MNEYTVEVGEEGREMEMRKKHRKEKRGYLWANWAKSCPSFKLGSPLLARQAYQHSQESSKS